MAKEQTEIATVAVKDNSIWAKHISDHELADRVVEMRDEEIVSLEIDGVLGIWAKMKTGENNAPVPGLKPGDDETKAHWNSLYDNRKDETVPIVEISIEELITRSREHHSQLAEAQDGLLRAKAEVENIRRRAQNEIADARKFAIGGFAAELLNVKDSLDQAASVELDDGAVANMKEGLALTLKQLDGAFARFAVEEVAAESGAQFDPEFHQAISTAPSGEIADGHIITVVQKGFRLKERLLRPAMVVVAAPEDGE